MLSQEQYEFLSWIDKQPRGACLAQMYELNAPHFNRNRFEELYADKMLVKEFGEYHNETAAFYGLSDKARAAISEFERIREKEAEDKRQQRFQNKVSVVSAVMPFITFVLGLLVEHFAGVIRFLSSLF